MSLARWAALLAVGAALTLPACQRRSPRPQRAAPAASGSAGGVASAAAGTPDDEPPSGPHLAEIDLGAGAPEARAAALLSAEQGTFFDLAAALERLADDERPGVLVRLGAGRVGWGRGAEVVRRLKIAREQGKVVYCHADELGNASYGLAAEACDRIWLSPAGGVDVVGLGAELMFARDLLAKVGVEADVLQVGKYKGTGETMTRSHASDEVKQSLQGALGGIRERWLEGIEQGRRGRLAGAVVERGPFAPEEARRLGLIDEVGYAHEALRALRQRLGAGKTDVVFGPQTVEAGSGGLVGLVRGLSGGKRPGHKGRAGGKVVVLRASGSITMERSRGPLGGSGGIVARSLGKQIRSLTEDTSVSAVVLRIDSPGGSALASDLLWSDLMRLRARKPLVVSVGDMAASGGYYLACAGSKILAEETSIVGSIGVVGGKVAAGGALERVGVHVEVIPAHASGDANRVAYNSSFIRWDEASRERTVATMESVYNLFLKRVAEGRSVEPAVAASFAEGRIFAGREALARGMIDGFGGLGEAIALARSEAGLRAEAEVELHERRGNLEGLLDLDEEELRARGAPAGWLPLPEGAVEYAASMEPLLRGERALVALPFALLVR